MSCNQGVGTSASRRYVSIPIGFSNELQLGLAAVPAETMVAEFQSLSGFPMSCNRRRDHFGTHLHGVSIPIGFSNELQLYTLLGMRSATLVSIPIGFSNELQLRGKSRAPEGILYVSIPIGFSNELQLPAALTDARPFGQFQSLSGFPMSCNMPRQRQRPRRYRFQSLSGFPMSCNMNARSRRLSEVIPVSIPIGFSNELQHPVREGERRPGLVSIPIGFSNELQLPLPCRAKSKSPSFNPYRVFQ